MTKIISVDEYRGLVGTEIAVSRWFLIDQERIDRFADVTEDLQYIHVDAERAKGTVFGGTIAHGYLTLSMLACMAAETIPHLENMAMGLNYGMNSLRFLAPVRSGKNIRGRFSLRDFSERAPSSWKADIDVAVEIEGESKPALVAEWVLIMTVSPPVEG